METYGSPPTIIAGDLNGDMHRIPILEDAIENGDHVDLGANAHLWGQMQVEPT